ncbi:MAG: ABC transporter substrate-binding protein [Rikenellaceae bacterium]|nr:ABC transporter substrate-binding protein [Rikenellaceae bacterium]
MKRISILLACLGSIVLLASCGGPGKSAHDTGDTLRPLYEARYAERFELLTDDGGPVLRVRNPWQGADSVVYDYRLVSDTAAVLRTGEIRYPIRKAVCMSSTHVAFLDAVGAVGVVKGVSGLDFITNPAVHAADVKEVGYDNNLNYEMIVALQPDVVFIYGLTGENSAVAKLQQLGVPVVYISDYLENDPLGRAEWIVPFGLLAGRMEDAVAQFMHTENEYNSLGERVAGSVDERPEVMLNSPYKDVWYLPGDRSYMVRLLEDAGGDYLGKGEDTDVSRPVSAEKALVLMARADYWLNPGRARDMSQLRADNRRFATLPVVQKGKVYNNNARITPMGGSDFWESGAVRPDVVLSDMVRILHPDLLPEHELYYFRKLE